MNAIHNAVAVLFPGVDSADIIKASEKFDAEIIMREQFSEQKDYTRFFKRSKRMIDGADMNLLFIYADGSAQLAKDIESLKKALKKAALETGAFA